MKKGPLVVFFYPVALSAGCTLQTCTFRDYYSQFRELGASIVGISADAQDQQGKFTARREVPFPLLSDPDYAVHEAFGFGKGRKARATFVLDAEHRIVFAWQARLRFKAHAWKALDVVKGMVAQPHTP